jgi:homoserine kinase
VTIHVRAPATSANLGPGFDCAGVALELWNELRVEDSDELVVDVEGEGADEAPRDESHLGLRAFALVAPVEGKRFSFRNRIPFARGLGSSSATIALGLVAGCAAAGRAAEPEELLQLAMQLENHADNLAPCLLGGATLAWADGDAWHARRVADTLPLEPIAVIPRTRVETPASRPPARPCSAPPSPRATATCSRLPSTTACTSPIAPPTRRCCVRSSQTRPTARPASPSRAPARPCSSGPTPTGPRPAGTS